MVDMPYNPTKPKETYKNYRNEAASIKSEINSEWNFFFFKILGMFKNYRVWSCVYKDENE